MAASISKIGLIVGSTNPNKVMAAQKGISTLYAQNAITAIPYKADPGITQWKSQYAIGQPFGVHQTAFGAINRMNDCWRKRQQLCQEAFSNTIVTGLENGLVKPIEVGQDGKNWFDICFTAIRDSDPDSAIIIKRGKFVKTEFTPPETDDPHQFDAAVKTYEALIMPSIAKKQDLYLGWTSSHPDGPKSREHFLSECLSQALKEQSHLQEAKAILDVCVQSGMTASAGLRYQNMLWTRDLAYMAPVYLQRGYQANFIEALKNIRQAQCCQHSAYHNGYESFNRFGNIPIVCIPPKNACSYLRQRLRGTLQDPAWQIQLWNFCAREKPERLLSFPLPVKTAAERKDIKDLTLDHLSLPELKAYYHQLLTFQHDLQIEMKEHDKQPPKPSFALHQFMAGNIENITPGTRDSEIHYIRAIFALIKHDPQNSEALLKEFGASIAKALFYLYMNVIDSTDGLPRGADSRDIFADILYDSKLLTNAVFWYQALQSLCEHAQILGKSSFTATLLQALKQQSASLKQLNIKTPKVLTNLIKSKNLQKTFQNELTRLRASIHSKLLFAGDQFKPIDFLPGKRASIALDQPVNSTPIDAIIKKDNPTFIKGENIDPQALAHAVLSGLIPKKHYDQVLEYFAAADSKIGVQVFVPISGKTDEESLLLQKVKGQVVWPHVSWTVVKALIAMHSELSLNMAEEQRDKLMQLGGCSEWYALDPETQQPVQGGDPQQGWAATSMLMASEAFYNYYSLEPAVSPPI